MFFALWANQALNDGFSIFFFSATIKAINACGINYKNEPQWACESKNCMEVKCENTLICVISYG